MGAKRTQSNDKKAVETGKGKNVSGHFSRVTMRLLALYPVGRCAWPAFLGEYKEDAWVATFHKRGVGVQDNSLERSGFHASLDLIHRVFFQLTNALRGHAIFTGQIVQGCFFVTQPTATQYILAAIV